MRRLAYYAIGLAIGFMMLGIFQRLRTQEHQARFDERAQTGDTLTVPSHGSVESPAHPAVSADGSTSSRGSP
jgi:hypothetical protein